MTPLSRAFFRSLSGLAFFIWLGVAFPLSAAAQQVPEGCLSSPCYPCLTSPCEPDTLGVKTTGPSASIVLPPPGFTEGQTVTFSGDGSGSATTIVDWEWDFDYIHPAFTVDATGQVVQRAFADAKEYFVALRVRDTNEQTFLVFQSVNPVNIRPQAALQVRTIQGQVLSPPYTVAEGVPLTFDASASRVVPPDPGRITGYQWDWNYNGHTFQPDPTTTLAIHNRSFPQDTEGSPPYKVRLRVIDDDSTVDNPSDDYITVEITVTDIKPQAQIMLCDRPVTSCSPPPSGRATIKEDDITAFRVRDNSGNMDPIMDVQWDLAYTGTFNANPTFAGMLTVEHSWGTIGLRQIASRITDSEGDSSLGLLEVMVEDKPPTARITPAGVDNILTVDEGSVVVFSAQTSSVPAGDRFVRFRWDENLTGNSFNPNPQHDLTSTCSGGTCSRFSWLGCTTADDCPLGRGSLNKTMGDGPSSFKIALCVEDDDVPGICEVGANPTSPSVTPRIHVLTVQVRNVAPTFNPDYYPPSVIDEGSTFNWCPVLINPAGDSYSFDCDPTKLLPNMECDTQTGCLSWIPSPDTVSCQVGDNPLSYSLKVCDKDGGCTTLNRTIEVRNINNPPSIVGFNGPASAVTGQQYTATLYAEDPDSRCGDAISYYLCGQTAPQMTFDLNGVFRWTPTSEQTGNRNVGFCVRDQVGAADCSICHYHSISVVGANEVPSISLGTDRTERAGRICVEGQILTNPGNRDLTYTWRRIRGPQEVCFESLSTYPAVPRTCFGVTARGEYEISLGVNNGSFTVEDNLLLTISNLQPGVVLAGDRNYDIGTLIELDASRSGDYNVNDTDLRFSWTDYRGVLNSTTLAVPSFTPQEDSAIGIYEFDLVVNDGQMMSPPGRDDLVVEVLKLKASGEVEKALPYAVFRALVCDEDGHCEDADTVYPTVGAEFLLDASASSSRPPGGELTYNWVYLEGPVTPTWGTLPNERHLVRASAVYPGHYIFGLRVTEGDRRSRLYTRTITVVDAQNVPPVASAGDDLRVTLVEQCGSPRTDYVLVELNGSASRHPNGENFDYLWTQVGGIPVPLTGQQTARPTFYVFEPGVYTFDLEVATATMRSRSDQVHVAVTVAGSAAPFITISHPRYNRERRTITTDPGQEVIIDASGSSSPVGRDIFFEWAQTQGPPVVLSDWTGSVVSFIPDLSGQTYQFQLIVWDEDGSASPPFDLKVVVLLSDNSPPTCAVAVSYIGTVVGNVVELDASPTYDIDADDVLTYQWVQIEEESVAVLPISDANQTVARVQPTAQGDYVFEFFANDGHEDCEPVRVLVNAAPNSPPVANAGPDLEFCVGQTIQLDGTASSDPDGHALGYRWAIVDDGGTGLVTGDFAPGASDPKPTLPAINPGTLTIELVVTDGFENGESEPDTLKVLVRSLCEGIDCRDEDEDGYYVGVDCDFDDPATPYDCDDTDPDRNAGIIGSCSQTDGDGDSDGDDTGKSKKGGGCRSASTPWLPLSGFLMLLALAGLRSRRRGY